MHRALRLLFIAIVGLAITFGLATSKANAGAQVHPFSGYDLTQTTPRPCDIVEKPYCNHAPTVNATSYFATTMINTQAVYHYPVSDLTCACGEKYTYTLDITAGQQVGVLCWTGIWDKVDYRRQIRSYTGDGSALWIAYVPDGAVVLDYSDRINLPHC